MKDSVSIIIPAHNEEKNISHALKSVKKALAGIKDWEIIIVNDGSTDRTAEIIDEMARKDRRIKIIHFPDNWGIGMVWQKGIAKASKTYIGGFPGDNDMASDSLTKLLTKRTEADIIISYMSNPGARSLFRQIISKTYVVLMNFLCGLSLRYFNGYFVARAKLLKELKLQATGFSIFAEIIAKMIKKGAKYKEIPFIHTGRKFGTTSSISVQSVLKSFLTAFKISYDLRRS